METNRKHDMKEAPQPPRAIALGNPIGDLAYRSWGRRRAAHAPIETLRPQSVMADSDFNPGLIFRQLREHFRIIRPVIVWEDNLRMHTLNEILNHRWSHRLEFDTQAGVVDRQECCVNLL